MGRDANHIMAPPLTAVQYDLIYNMTSLGLASMAASTTFFFLRLSSFHERYKTALCFTGLVTFIAMYHYFRIFNSFTEAYTPCKVTNGTDGVGTIDPHTCDADKYGYTPSGHSLVLLDFVHDPLLLHRLHSVHRPQGFPGVATRGVPGGSEVGMLGYCLLMVHIPSRVHFPHAVGLH